MWPSRQPFAGRSTPLRTAEWQVRSASQVTGHPNYGVPFGQDRIVPIFLATLAIQQKSQTIQCKSAAEMLETFGMSKGGKEYRQLVAAFERTFGATIFFGTDSLTSNAKVVHRARFNRGAPAGRRLSFWTLRRCNNAPALPGTEKPLFLCPGSGPARTYPRRFIRRN